MDLLSKSEYYPYGMKINDLSYNATGARYGYNGTHEQDEELNADGNYLDFGNFGYDTRVAMRRNQEPLRMKYPGLSGYAVFGNNPIYFQDPDGHDLNSALIEGSIALTLDLGLNVISDVVFGNKEINSSLRKHIGGAVYEGVKTTLIAVLLPPGSTSYKKIEKFATSKIGKFTSKFIANYLERTALNLSKGEYKDKNGNYTIKNTVIEIGEDLIIAMLETLIDEGMNDAAFDHFQKLANKSERLTKAYEKLLNSKGNSLKSLQNKVEKATKELGKEVGGAIVKEGKKSTLKKSTEMKVEEISDKVKKYYNEDPLPEEFEIEVNTDEGD